MLDVMTIELDEELDLELVNVEIMEHPCFVLDRILFSTELQYMADEGGLPVYFENERVGYLTPTLEKIRRLQFLGTGIRFTSSVGELTELNTPEGLYRFITLGG